MQNAEKWLEIGKIVAPQGLKGELRVISSSDFPERFEKPGMRWLQSPNGVSIEKVELIRGRYVPGKNIYIIKLSNIVNRNQAETLRDYKLLVSSSDRPQINEDEYHFSDLINLEVYHQKNNELIGVVTNIFLAGNDLLEVKLYQNKSGDINLKKQKKNSVNIEKKILIPFVYDIVPVVDLVNKRIEINPPLGLLELN
ncbi:MAG TPA: ribosome maturation factor RimM [Cyanothece sp. UBA12306]|nr:ribosome maturation factor RimM [Cyanothece sp. UBA12306]